MKDVQAANLLIPDGSFVGFLIGYVLILGLLVLWPLVESVSRRRWGWFVAILFLGPLAGIAWFVWGRRQSPQSAVTY
jgi:hypothetical protein